MENISEIILMCTVLLGYKGLADSGLSASLLSLSKIWDFFSPVQWTKDATWEEFFKKASKLKHISLDVSSMFRLNPIN